VVLLNAPCPLPVRNVEMQMIEAFVLIRVGTGEQLNFAKAAKEEIGKIEGVVGVFGVFGSYDIIAHVKAETLEALSRTIVDKIRSITGVLATESLIIGW
jgi:DNA-binding Lrp family transcriptional regulator